MAVGAGRVFAIKLIADSNPVTDAFSKVAQAAGRLPTPMLAVGAAIAAGFAVVVTGVTKITSALLTLGEEFDDVYDNIRIQTGATGVVLGALEESFRDVARVVPNDFADVGVVIQDLNTRLGLSGEPLEELAIQLLTVSRLMGGDVGTNVREVSRLFQNFNIPVEEQARTLDLLFKASQASGIGFSELATQVTDGGAQLRTLGFSLDDSIAMLALFEREGIDSAGMISALGLSVRNLAKNGEDIPTAFARVIDSIRDAGTQSDAMAIGTEVAGRNALRLVDAVRNGKFDIDAFSGALAANGETILGAAGETDGFREAWGRFKNYIKLTLEPVAMAVFDNLEILIGDLEGAVDRVVTAFEKDGIEGALEQVAIEWDSIYENRLKPLWEDKFLPFLNDTVKPLVIEVGTSVGAAFATAIWNGFKEWFNNNWYRLLTNLVSKLTPSGLLQEFLGDFVFPRLPDFDYDGPIGGSGPDGAEVRGLLRLGAGGLVTSPVMAQVGEAGPEVVIPLDRFERQYGSGSGDVYLTVNGALDAEGTARTILRVLRDAERRSGDRLTVGG